MQTGLTARAESVRQAPGSQKNSRFRQILSAVVLSLFCILSTPLAANGSDPASAEQQIITADSNYPSTTTPLNAQSPAAATSAADLSLFGILALGIIGLLWVRRHTSEL